MRGYIHRKCKTELHFHQIQGIRLLREDKGKMVYDAYCPKCKSTMKFLVSNPKYKKQEFIEEEEMTL